MEPGGMQVVGEDDNGREAVRLTQKSGPNPAIVAPDVAAIDGPGAVVESAELSSQTQAGLLYLDLLKKCLTRYIFGQTYVPLRRPMKPVRFGALWALYRALERGLAWRNLQIVRRLSFDPSVRALGNDWPLDAETMIGLERLHNLEYCVADVIHRRVPGDLLEAGVWRGGASIFMRGVLKAYGDTTRIVWVADSFQGLPKSDTGRYAKDASGDWNEPYWRALAVPLEEVRANFARYGLLDDQVRFLSGWFKDTLPSAPIGRLAVLRVDADMYSSTLDVLKNLYHLVSIGGYVIIDDYGAISACEQAVKDFRAEQKITEELKPIKGTGAFWQRCR